MTKETLAQAPPGPPPARDPTQRFSSRVDNYARYRPSYPSAAIELLRERCGLNPAAVVADVGSGTGILTGLLLATGARVYAVEPNGPMRAAAEASLGESPRYHSVCGSAEATTLAAASIDLYVAAQAFHWFDVARARAEALRIVRAGASGALLWNERPRSGSPFHDDYDALLRRHAPEYDAVVASRAEEAQMRAFFGGRMQLATFANEQLFDYDGLVGRLMSSSYAPERGHPQHEPLLAGLRALFQRHALAGTVAFPYLTLVYYAPLP
ncbi:MAG TPA: class I SAM-dependent methyltransferase [Steroidobacteraceae bacterium]|nr:class I SAM-dependent methyltransferase [Steroidobacteraceae bacterium]